MHAAPSQANVEHQRAALLAQQGLTADDVAALRVGRLSGGAVRAIQKGMSTAYVLAGVGAFFAALGVGLGLAMVRVAPETVRAIGGVRVGWPALIGPFAGVVLAISAVLHVGRIRRATRSPVEFFEGASERGVGRKGRRFLQVGSTQLYEHHQRVVAQVAEHVFPGTALRVYLTQQSGLSSGIVVGVEPLPAPPTTAAPCRWYAGREVVPR
jgi:hypothetical protein